MGECCQQNHTKHAPSTKTECDFCHVRKNLTQKDEPQRWNAEKEEMSPYGDVKTERIWGYNNKTCRHKFRNRTSFISRNFPVGGTADVTVCDYSAHAVAKEHVEMNPFIGKQINYQTKQQQQHDNNNNNT